ncbi:MAG: ribosome biogenesis GTP-binding protein YihA/YsxC [Cyclobacteriaceae bacterium]|nr:ribosome biogenesis GTP-binding protein YihA/YsxC [Cyclobacteriaceae bacterium]
MKITSSQFVISNTDYKKCPKPDIAEFAFIGRSNVGKSSLINMLTNKSKLAKTSSSPGKTQLINHFIINDNWYLVDLPGYGWAKVSKSEKAKWQVMIKDYFQYRENLTLVFVLIDSRLDPQKIDIEYINWLGENGVPIALIFTKSDKQTKNKTDASIAKFRKTLQLTWDELPPHFITSSVNENGKKEVLNYIDDIITTKK